MPTPELRGPIECSQIKRMAESLWAREGSEPVLENSHFLNWALPIFERFTAQQFVAVLGDDYQQSHGRASAFSTEEGIFFLSHTTYQETTREGEVHKISLSSFKIRWSDEKWQLDTILIQTSLCQTLSFLRVSYLGRSVEINNLTSVIK